MSALVARAQALSSTSVQIQAWEMRFGSPAGTPAYDAVVDIGEFVRADMVGKSGKPLAHVRSWFLGLDRPGVWFEVVGVEDGG